MYCENCGQRLDESVLFCKNCGTKIERTVELEQDIIVRKKGDLIENNKIRAKIHISKKIIVAIVAISIIVFAIIGIISFLGKGSDDRLFYLKEKQLNVFSAGMEVPTRLEKNIYENEISFDYIENESSFGYIDNDYVLNCIQATSNGKGAYYIADISDGKGKLYYKDFNKAKINEDYEGEHISSGVFVGKWSLIDNDTLIYSKDAGLYLYSSGDEFKITSDVVDYMYSEGNILYKTDDDTLYIVSLDKLDDNTKIADDINRVISYTPGFGEVYFATYDEDYTVYKYMNGKDKEKVCSGVGHIVAASEQTIYYTKRQEETALTLYDYVKDDLLESDNSAVKPDIFDYQTERLVSGGDSDYYRTKTDYDSYREARDKYYEASRRLELREILQETYVTSSRYTLYCYKNGKESVVAENTIDSKPININDNSTCSVGVYYNKLEDQKAEKVVNIQDIHHRSEVYDYIDQDDDLFGTVFVSVDGEKENKIFDNKEFYIYKIETLGENKLVVSANNYNNKEIILVTDISKGKIAECKKIAECEKIYNDYDDSTYEKGEVYYFTDLDDNDCGTLYRWREGKIEKISEDVYYYLVFGEANELMFFKDLRGDMGTLYGFNGKKQFKIADDVFGMMYVGSDIYYLQDYNPTRDCGDLYRYIKEGKKELVDDSVAFFTSL